MAFLKGLGGCCDNTPQGKFCATAFAEPILGVWEMESRLQKKINLSERMRSKTLEMHELRLIGLYPFGEVGFRPGFGTATTRATFQAVGIYARRKEAVKRGRR